MVALPKQPLVSGMSVTEFLSCPADPAGRTWQLIDGKPVLMALGSDTHGSIQAEIAGPIGNHLRAAGSPCRVVIAPGVTPRVRAEANVRVPDLAVTCTPASRRTHLVTEPVLVVEILSPSNEGETWSSVWAYTTLPSVQQILIVQSLEIGAELLTRQPDGTWPTDPEKVTGPLRLTSISGDFHLPDFYATTELAQLSVGNAT